MPTTDILEGHFDTALPIIEAELGPSGCVWQMSPLDKTFVQTTCGRYDYAEKITKQDP